MQKKFLLLPILALVLACGSSNNSNSSNQEVVSENDLRADAQKLDIADQALKNLGCEYNYMNYPRVELSCSKSKKSPLTELYIALENSAQANESFANKYYGKIFTYKGETRRFDNNVRDLFVTKAKIARDMMISIQPKLNKELEAQRKAKEKQKHRQDHQKNQEEDDTNLDQ